MPPEDLNNDPAGNGHQSALEGNWYDPLVGDDTNRAELFSQYESVDKFVEDYSAIKNRDWRAEIAGNDEKFRSTLDRFDSPQAFGNSFREAQQKIRSGQLKSDLPEDATDDQIKEWRRANNIPLEPDGYLKDLPDGLVIGEEDKEIVAGFVEKLHGKNASPEIVHEALRWYNDFAEQTQNEMAEIDTTQRQETINQLKGDWGADFTTNMNLINSMLDAVFGKEAREKLVDGRYGNGAMFFNDPDVLKGFSQLARLHNPHGKPLPNDMTALQATEDEIAEIENVMKTDRKRYNEDAKMQARLRELYDIRLRAQGDDAA